MVDIGPINPPRPEPDTLKLAPQYAKDGPKFKADPYDFDNWWEQYVNAPVNAANNLDGVETKIIPLTANRLPEPTQDQEVDLWKVFAYLIMIVCGVVAVCVGFMAVLSVVFAAIVFFGLIIMVVKMIL